MKKRTIITTEKREVWVIRNGSATLESTTEDSRDESEALTTIDHDTNQPVPEKVEERDE